MAQDLAGCGEFKCFNWVKFSQHTKVVGGCFKPGLKLNEILIWFRFSSKATLIFWFCFQVNNFRKRFASSSALGGKRVGSVL